MDEPRRRHDPLALAVIGAAVLLLVALVAGLIYSVRSAPAPAPVAPKAAPAGPSLGERISELTRLVAKEIADAVREDRPMKMPGTSKPPPAAKAPPPKPAAAPSPAAAKGAPAAAKLPPGRVWHYRVGVTPPTWRDVTLTYRSVEQVKGTAVYTEFRHAGGKSNFQLGMFQAGHPSHANTRFPGFFLYASYLDPLARPGDPVAFGWPWQGRKPGSMKRFDGRVVSAGMPIDTPAGRFPSILVRGAWSYVEDGQVRARAEEEFWYVPAVSQVVRVERRGATPDESSSGIVAELIEFR